MTWSYSWNFNILATWQESVIYQSHTRSCIQDIMTEDVCMFYYTTSSISWECPSFLSLYPFICMQNTIFLSMYPLYSLCGFNFLCKSISCWRVVKHREFICNLVQPSLCKKNVCVKRLFHRAVFWKAFSLSSLNLLCTPTILISDTESGSCFSICLFFKFYFINYN